MGTEADDQSSGPVAPPGNDPDAPGMRLMNNGCQHSWVKAWDALDVHPNRLVCSKGCGAQMDVNRGPQPYTPPPKASSKAGY